jgi:hypothetical protein
MQKYKNAFGNCVHASFQYCYCLPTFFHVKLLSSSPNAFRRRLFRHLGQNTRALACLVPFPSVLVSSSSCPHFARCSSLTWFKQPRLSHLPHTQLLTGWQRRLIAHAIVHSRMLTVSAGTCLLKRSLAGAVCSFLLRICCLATGIVPLCVFAAVA